MVGVHVASDLPRIQADEARIKQVLINLLDNALRHTSSGGRVEVSVGRGEGEVIVSVVDTGVGIAPEDLP